MYKVTSKFEGSSTKLHTAITLDRYRWFIPKPFLLLRIKVMNKVDYSFFEDLPKLSKIFSSYFNNIGYSTFTKYLSFNEITIKLVCHLFNDNSNKGDFYQGEIPEMRLNLKIISEEKTVPALITLFEEAIPSSLVQLGKHFRFVFDADARHFLELTRNMNYGKKKLLHPIFPRTITMGRLILIDLKPFPGRPIKDIIRELLVKIHSALVYDTVVIIPKCKSIFVTYLSMHNSVTRFQQLSKLLEIFYEVLSLGIPLTYRAIYYRDQQLFQSSDKASSLVSSIAENFDVKETELNIYKTSSTLITGDVFVKHVPRPYVIGENFKEELEVKRNIPFVTILVLEKASVMYPVLSLLEKRKWINYLIISSRGYRDSHLIDYLSWLTQLSISFKLFVCTDPNIHGMNIYCDIKKVFKNCQRLLFSINELDARYRMMDGNSVAAQLGTNLLLKNKDLTNTEKEELKQLLVQRTKLELDQIPNIYYKIIAQMESLAPEVIDTI